MSAVGRRERARKRELHRRLTGAVEPEKPEEPKRVGVRTQGARTMIGQYRMPLDGNVWLRQQANTLRGRS